MTVLDDLRTRLTGLQEQVSNLDEIEGRNGKLLASETRQRNALVGDANQLINRINQLQDEEVRRAADAASHVRVGTAGTNPGVGARGADAVYARGNGLSYFADLAMTAVPGSFEAKYEAEERLRAHAQVIDRAVDDLPDAFKATRTRRAAGSGVEYRVNPNRTDGQGGYMVPPLWQMSELVAVLRAGRAIADRCHHDDLPTGTDSINLPKLNTGTTTAVQTADAAAVSSTDFTDTSVSSGVKTIAGQQDIALQLLEQSPLNLDEVLFTDLMADYNQRLDIQVLSGSNASGQVQGIFGLSGINGVTYIDASPTVPEMYPAVMQSLSQIARQRFKPADTIGMHPTRWYWICSALDTQNRPLVVPDANTAVNNIAVYDANAVEGIAGSIAGVPVVVDANIPINYGAGNNQDRILVGRYQDAYLYEGALRTRAMPEILSGTLQVRLQVYNYFAFIPGRYPVAFTTLDGTGLIQPAGY
jgi:HK97 family phage major capsid protein